ncbi:hypothetical protein [Actinomadura sp. DC4]|uniref:hypothetical protein n=1 Tax=Actinomadura sp. DC4 TaxID=3055069 RepID=UPI0025AF455E|nr:hypothetical protein [Actinomadura sp. DC4]MDN3355427.1 hypothetical protein [Actinomadura sp. DC4]
MDRSIPATRNSREEDEESADFSDGQETIESLRARPGDPRAVRTLARRLRDGAVGLPPAGTIAALEESERLYMSLPGDTAVAALADVRCRKGQAQASAGLGASAVLTMDESLSVYDALGANRPHSPYSLDYAHAFLINAGILRRYGDPDLAVASADGAIRQYLHRRDEINSSLRQAVHIGRFHQALAIASELHAAGGRFGLAHQVDAMAIEGAPRAGDMAVRARARKAVHLRADGRAREADELSRHVHASSPKALAEAEDVFARSERLTLRQAVGQARSALGEQAVPPPLDALLTDPSQVLEAGWCVSLRGPEDVMATGASHLVRASLALPDGAGELRRTLALEAHYLFAVASLEQVPDLRHRFGSHGSDWARALLWLTRSARDGDAALADDLAGWLRGVLLRLRPYALVDAEAQTAFEEGNRFVLSRPEG